MKKTLLLLCISIVSTMVFSQKKNLNLLLRDFINTPFMIEYQKTQLEIERLTKDFLIDQAEFNQKDFRKVRDSYDITSKAFNDVLEEINNDLLDKKMRKVINVAPELYKAKLDGQLVKLKEIYATNFLQTLSDVRGETINGGSFLQTLTILIQTTISVVDYIVSIKYKNAKFNDEFLKDRLITPYSFLTWDQLQNSYNNDTSIESLSTMEGN